MADAKLEIILNAKDNTKGAFSSVNKELSGLGSNAKTAGSALGGMAVGVAKVGAVAGGVLVAGIGAAVKSAMDFETALSEIQSVSNATGDEMNQLRTLALRMGKDTSFSAKDAAQGIAELAKAGVSTADIMGGALQGSLALAAAGGIDVGRAAEVASQAMNIFGLQGKDVTHVADLFSAGANKSATSVDQLAAAFNQSAAVAKMSGVSIEELTGTLSMFAQSGLQGSDAGTSLKTALIALQNPTDKSRELMEELGINVFDSQGKFVGLAGVADELREALSGMSQEQRNAALATIFGSDAIRVASILFEEGGEGVRQWTNAVNDSGAAQRVAATRLDNLGGSLEQLKGSLETAAIEMGSKFLPVIRRGVDEVTKLVNAFMDSPQAQKAIQDLATNAGKALDTIINKVKDPAFQQEMKEWANTALDVAKAVGDLAADIGSALGPVLKSAAQWFSSLDEDGRKNVVMFGLVAGAAAGFHRELGTLLSVGNNVIRMFADKLAAKQALTKANQTLAGSATGTSTAMQAVRAAAAGAGVVIAEGAVIAGGAAVAWGGLITAADAYNDASGTTARNIDILNAAMSVNAFAIAHGANELNAHAAGFNRFIESQRLTITSTNDLATAWNSYLQMLTLTQQGTDGLVTAMTAQAAAQQAVNQVLGEGLVAGTQFNDTYGMMGGAARALAATLPPVGAGFSAAALAAGELADVVPFTAAGLNDINTYGSTAQTRLNEVAGAALRLALEAQGLNIELGGLITTHDTIATQMKLVSSESGTLGGWLGTLQSEWDELDAAVKKQGYTTAEQAKRYAELAPLIQFLNARGGELKNRFVELTEAAVRNWMAVDQAKEKYGAASAAAMGAEAGAKLFGKALDTATGAAKSGATASDTQATAVKNASAAMIAGVGSATALAVAIKSVPKEFTVTAKVDISGALAAIDTLNAHLPHSPAEEGPLSELPNWAALFEELPAEAAKAGADAAKAIADAITALLGAQKALANFDFEKDSPTGEDLGWFRHLTESLLATMQEAASAFEDKALEHTNKFADTVGKVGGSVKNAVDGLLALGKADWANASPDGNAMGWFMHLVQSLVQNFVDAGANFEEDGLKGAERFADAVGKVTGVISGAVTGLQALAKFVAPSEEKVSIFMKSLADLMEKFGTWAGRFEQDGLEASARFAEAAGKVTGMLDNGVKGLMALSTFVAPAETQVTLFMTSLSDLMEKFGTWAGEFEADVLESTSRFAEAAGKVAGVIGPAIDGFAKLATFSAPSETAISQLAEGIKAVVRKFAAMATMLDAEGTEATSKFAEAAGKVLGAAKTGVELFAAMSGDKDKAGNNVPVGIPSAKAIDELAEGIKYVIRKFAEMARGMEEQGIKEMQAFASAAGQVLSAAKTGTDLFKQMEKLAVPSAEAIDYLLGTIGLIITKIRQIAAGIGEQGLREAQAFGEGSFNVISTLAGGLKLFEQLAQFKDIPAQKLEELWNALDGALDFARKLFERASAIKAEAAAFANEMKEAARLFAEGMSLANGLPATMPSAPLGVGGNGGSGGNPGGIGGAPVYNLTIAGDVYDGGRFEDRVVSALTMADRRGRTR